MVSGQWRAAVVGISVVFLLATGCRKDSGAAANATDEPVDNVAAIAEAAGNPAVVAKLAAADSLDGKVDGVISRCGGYALHMDGSPTHTLTVGKYTMQFCSRRCRSGFASDPVKRILALSISDGD